MAGLLRVGPNIVTDVQTVDDRSAKVLFLNNVEYTDVKTCWLSWESSNWDEPDVGVASRRGKRSGT